MTPKNKTGSIKVKIEASTELLKMPKLIELQDAEQNVLDSFWLQDDIGLFSELSDGIYVIWLKTTTGKEFQNLVQLKESQDAEVFFKLKNQDSQVSRSKPYKVTIKPMAGSDSDNLLLEEQIDSDGYILESNNITLKTLTFIDGVWKEDYLLNIFNSDLENPNFRHRFHSNSKMQLIKAEFENLDDKIICCPPNSTITIRFKRAKGPIEFVHPWNILLHTDNTKAEGLLDLISSGSIQAAKSLMSEKEAEGLLYSKMADCSAAAIGAYYLLKTGDLSRLHDWASNLADRFEYMSDGAIIYAWQLMTKDEQNTSDLIEIKKWLITAVNRGLPIYTQGLRLLKDGLSQLSLIDTNDNEIKTALVQTHLYCRYVDWSQKLTTLNIFNAYDLFPKPIEKIQTTENYQNYKTVLTSNYC